MENLSLRIEETIQIEAIEDMPLIETFKNYFFINSSKPDGFYKFLVRFTRKGENFSYATFDFLLVSKRRRSIRFINLPNKEERGD
jgi:hypothetical protein